MKSDVYEVIPTYPCRKPMFPLRHYFVRLLFRNVTDSDEVQLLKINSCNNPSLCSLEEFQQ